MPLVSEFPPAVPPAETAYPPGWSAPGEQPERRRPGTVVAAVVVTWSAAGIVLLATASLVVFALWLGGPLLDAFDGSRRLVFLVAGGTTVWSLVACALAWSVLAGKAWARWALVVSAAATTVVSLLGVFLVVPLVPLVAAPVVVALLFIGGANAWFDEESTA
jgi:hypothetical protein